MKRFFKAVARVVMVQELYRDPFFITFGIMIVAVPAAMLGRTLLSLY